MAFSCEADRLPPPTGLSYEWLDNFTINISWQKPITKVDHCDILYEVQQGEDMRFRTESTNITKTCMTEELDSTGCKYTIRTVGKELKCDRTESEAVTIPIDTRVPRAELVKDFKCVIYPRKMNCSWIPVNPSLNLTVHYRFNEVKEGYKLPLKSCEELYSNGKRNGCYLKDAFTNQDIYMLVRSEAGQTTFKAFYVFPSPKMNITEEGNHLKLTWTRPEHGKSCSWKYEVCYRECNGPRECRNFTAEEEPLLVPYNKRCLYEFEYKATISNYCSKIPSDSTEALTYGTNAPPDGTLTVVAIVIPVILCVCVILSCYCFRRHRAIICPVIPDPSAIFKEMIMNGNKELKAKSNLYTPVPEPIEPCKVTLVPENSVLQQNS
ncbi:interleukin-13 receptor subunit alpha-1-like [Scomber japonicus]|uniref:interleukin-13 receptor subunit alpha-1-like n=1 Tax=Scomber japonicus TaxID=13676 RepID=UPI0023060DC5|nr:interleukin-13 receptor subunit alpha-1-like [Scomber japonicus]